MPNLRKLAVLAALALAGCGFSQKDLYCERAGGHLVECCPGYQIESIQCEQLRESDSRCIVALPCKTLVEGGYCDAGRLGALVDLCSN